MWPTFLIPDFFTSAGIVIIVTAIGDGLAVKYGFDQKKSDYWNNGSPQVVKKIRECMKVFKHKPIFFEYSKLNQSLMLD